MTNLDKNWVGAVCSVSSRSSGIEIFYCPAPVLFVKVFFYKIDKKVKTLQNFLRELRCMKIYESRGCIIWLLCIYKN